MKSDSATVQHLREMLFLSFFILPGSAEALVRWGDEIKYLLIADFLVDICAKNYQNRLMFVGLIARQSISDIFGTRTSFYCTWMNWVMHGTKPAKYVSAWYTWQWPPCPAEWMRWTKLRLIRLSWDLQQRQTLSVDYVDCITPRSAMLLSHRVTDKSPSVQPPFTDLWPLTSEWPLSYRPPPPTNARW